MKKSFVIIIVLAALIGIVFFWYAGTYNNLVRADEAVTAQWGNVESQYQRRSDLIPNLVSSVKGYAAHEEKTLTEVVEARAKATQTTVDPSNMTSEALAKYQAAQSGVGAALNRLLMTVENYPDLKANQNFMDLQAQLEGTENRIATERMRFNDEAKNFNTLMRKFPASIVANMAGFLVKPYFKSEEGAEKAPKVEF